MNDRADLSDSFAISISCHAPRKCYALSEPVWSAKSPSTPPSPKLPNWADLHILIISSSKLGV